MFILWMNTWTSELIIGCRLWFWDSSRTILSWIHNTRVVELQNFASSTFISSIPICSNKVALITQSFSNDFNFCIDKAFNILLENAILLSKTWNKVNDDVSCCLTLMLTLSLSIWHRCPSRASTPWNMEMVSWKLIGKFFEKVDRVWKGW